ncbi:hypothetical protein CCM_08333 [Cordyceps militaris CM01]|uniref:Secreted protein n=1 Tax=Cordyceps militaris (strain CM01) TaxID=983644 RepID=G3JTE3_CORMM|nr:uncharacterized protein CCM_08333 [Cordyceps militaris CM01]EGX88290.1 hypothetical protein CCM_08333 [Cordyceps militaris CM01]
MIGLAVLLDEVLVLLDEVDIARAVPNLARLFHDFAPAAVLQDILGLLVDEALQQLHGPLVEGSKFRSGSIPVVVPPDEDFERLQGLWPVFVPLRLGDDAAQFLFHGLSVLRAAVVGRERGLLGFHASHVLKHVHASVSGHGGCVAEIVSRVLVSETSALIDQCRSSLAASLGIGDKSADRSMSEFFGCE